MADDCYSRYQLQIGEFLMSDRLKELADATLSISGQIGGYATGIAAAGCGLYAVLWVISFVTGTQNGDIFSFLKWFAKALLLIAIAGSSSIYGEYVLDVFWEAPAEVAQFVANAGLDDGGISYDAQGRLNIGTALDKVASKGICSGTNIWKATSWWNPSESAQYFLSGLAVILMVVLFVALAGGLAFMGAASLSIVLSLGPLFIIAGIWETTRPMLESWLRTAINYAIYGVVLLIIVGLAVGMVDSGIIQSTSEKGADFAVDITLALGLAIKSLFIFGVGAAMLFKADDISASLVGGISMGAAGILGRAASMTSSPAKAMKTAANVAMNPAKAAGEFMGGNFYNDPRTGKAAYRGPLDSARNNYDALKNARAKNTIRPK